MEVQSSRKDDNELRRDDELPQCKIKRNYSCNHCTYFTQNPRFHLTHLRDIHGERIVINKCNLCLYASRHYQKLVRHMKMVHGSTEGIAGQSRKRASAEESACNQQQKKVLIPPLLPLLYPIEPTTHSENLSNDLELSRNSLKDIAALYFAENQIDKIMSQMEEADAVQLPPPITEDLSIAVKRKPQVGSFFDEIKNSFIHEGNLNCPCGHVSKCFSETIIHRRTCNSMSDRNLNEPPSLSTASGSSRCQHCRRRCKSSADLVNHLKNCLQYEILQRGICKATPPARNDNDSWNKVIDLERSGLDTTREKDEDPVAYDFFNVKSEIKSDDKGESDVEITAGSGEVSENGIQRNEDVVYLQSPQTSKKPSEEEEAGSSSFKKVFKCPRCSFWASTASRFHVHIVGHLNKKPFKCSLCTYRSNWRWDITKHIRLKSIRNPCHKNARVLMNDDTGRRNYTKYNKYITLMKINDEDGDPKLIKSGEMTPNQVASLGYLNESSQSDLANDDSLTGCKDQPTEKIDKTMCLSLADEKQHPVPGGIRKLSPPLLRLSDDLIIDIRTDGLEKKTFYKCRKCYFRHANRDAVLAHVRIHYQDPLLRLSPSTSKVDLSSTLQAAVNPASLYMNKVFAAAISLTQKQLLQDQKSRNDRNNSMNQYPILGEGTSSTTNHGQADDASKKTTARVSDKKLEGSENGPTCSALTSTTGSSSSGASSASSSSFIGDASKSAMLMGVISSTNFGNDAPDRREPSPFRCGHCHQVSNWKHVIQRHCRLKHSGNIRIETFDRSSEGRTPMYRPLDFCGNGQQRHSVGSTSDNYLLEAVKAQQQTPPAGESTKALIKGKSVHHLQDPSVSSGNSDQDFLLNNLEVSRLPYKSNSFSKQLKCPSCPYVSQNKTQLNFHTSLHKPSQFKCTMCSYICTKRQHLSNHLKVHESSMDSKRSDSDETTAAPAVDKVVSYCPKCPERFINGPKKLQQHLKAHGADLEFKCSACDFSTKQETIVLSHSLVHTNAYLDKLQQIAKDCKDDSEFPAQQLHTITLPKTGVTAWVIKSTNPPAADVDKSNQTKASSSETSPKCSRSNVDKENAMCCPYCPFQDDCYKTFQCHLQHHFRVSKRREPHLCEHCDFSTPSEDDLNEHTRLHFDPINNKNSAAFYTSFDKLELIVADNVEKKREDNKLTTKTIHFKNEPKITEDDEKTEKEKITNLRCRRLSSAAQKSEKKPSPASTSHKTILVNPKTGQVIRRN